MSQINIRCRGIILHEGKLLVVKHAGGRDFYALPGGHLDFGEDPKECMKRELIEELGIAPDIGKLLYVHTFIQNDDKQTIEFFFEITNDADYLLHAEKEKTHAHEIDECVWIECTSDVRILPEKIGKDFREGNLFSHSTQFFNG